jgi:hypothetical protein
MPLRHSILGRRAFVSVASAALAAAALTGCAPSSTLAIQRVVVYRNGVAYFERTGRVDQDEVRFRMRPEVVSDFLATLAVVDHGDGATVRSAAFAVPSAGDGDESKGKDAKSATVVLSVDGKGRDLRLGYVTQSPIWKPSYRVVLRPGGRAELQLWGVVQNLSGEDWKNVKLSLASGAPLAVRPDLGSTVIPSRPEVTDIGKQTDVPPRYATLQGAVGAQSRSDSPAAGYGYAQSDGFQTQSVQSQSLRNVGGATRTSETSVRKVGSAGGSRPNPPALPDSRLAPASEPPPVDDTTGSARYDVAAPITLRDESAAMVMALSRELPGESVLLFAPQSEAAESESHPVRVVRFTNETGAPLEPGPATLFDQGVFLGEGMIEAVARGATAAVPFLLETGVTVATERETTEAGAHATSIAFGDLLVDHERVKETRYRLRSDLDQPAQVLLKHTLVPKSRLSGAPAGTDTTTTRGAALVPCAVPPHASAEVVLDEHLVQRETGDWMSTLAESTVKAYLANPKADPDVVKKLTAAWALRTAYLDETRRCAALRDQVYTAAEAFSATSDPSQRARSNDLRRKATECDEKAADMKSKFDAAIREVSIGAL